MRRALCWAALAACSSSAAPPPPPIGSDDGSATPPTRPAKPPRPSAPHGGAIGSVAITDGGDAAFTVDDLGDARLWPKLDGTAEPIPVRAISSTTAIAIARTHAEAGFVVALLDTAGDATLVRLSPTGAELGRAQLQAPVRFEQVALLGDVVLARRNDQVLARFDAHGTPRGMLAAPPGEQIGTLATRAGAAVVVTGDSEHGFHTLRDVDVSGELGWGRTLELPHPISGRIALAPGHERVAAESALEPTVEIIDLAAPPKILGKVAVEAEPLPAMGFTDDEHLAVAHGKLEWWTSPQSQRVDPWTATTGSQLGSVDVAVEVSVGDGVLATAATSTLVLADPKATHWLGYQVLATPPLISDGAGQIVLGPVDSQLVWLDGALRQAHAWTIPADVATSNPTVFALDASHLVIQRNTSTSSEVELYDTSRPKEPVTISSYPGNVRVTVDVAQHVVVVFATDTRVERFRIDPAAMKVTTLAPLAVRSSTQTVWVTDPARADGLAALALGVRDDGYHMDAFMENKIDADGLPNKRPLKPVDRGTNVPTFVLPDGTTYGPGESGPETRRGKKISKLDLPPELSASGLIAISHDAQRLVVSTGHEAVVTDTHGAVIWRIPVWQMTGAVFSADDKQLVIGTAGGLIATDAATGKPTATGCAWQFGRWDKAIAERELGVVPVCAE